MSNNIKIYKYFIEKPSVYTKEKHLSVCFLLDFKNLMCNVDFNDIYYYENNCYLYVKSLKDDVYKNKFYKQSNNYLFKYLNFSKLNNDSKLIIKDYIKIYFVIDLFKYIRLEKIKKLL